MKFTVSEINDALDLAECCVHDKMHNPNEREWVHDILKKLRTVALQSVESENVATQVPGQAESRESSRLDARNGAEPAAAASTDKPHRPNRSKEFYDWLRSRFGENHTLSFANQELMYGAWQAALDVAAQNGSDATPHCSKCGGMGQDMDGHPCSSCGGAGK